MLFVAFVPIIMFYIFKGGEIFLPLCGYVIMFLGISIWFRFDYSRNELGFLVCLNKRRITSFPQNSFPTTIRTKKIDKIYLSSPWIFNYWPQWRDTLSTRPKKATVTEYSKRAFYPQPFFIIAPKRANINICFDVDSEGNIELTDKNYKKYKKIANNKRVILIDATQKNYEFLRQVFTYDKFEEKYNSVVAKRKVISVLDGETFEDVDTKHIKRLSDLEQTYIDKKN